MDTSKINSVGKGFDRAKYILAREKTIMAVNEVASKVEVGMSELDGVQLIEHVLRDYGYKQYWHPHKFRIGENTICSFRDISNERVRLQEDDIFFIDIGPVFDGHEGDYGRTFVFGQNQEYSEISFAAQTVFEICEKAWVENSLSGVELYSLAQEQAEKLGYVLEKRMSGHRLGDFPHALHYRGRLIEVSAVPKPDLWVLEILLINKERQFGAFYEDLLQGDCSFH